MGIPRPMSNAYGSQPVQEARAAAVLIAAPAWDTDPLVEMKCAGFSYMRLYLSYTPITQADAFTFRVELSPYSIDTAGVQNWFVESDTLLAAPVLAQGADSTNIIQRQDHTYGEVVVAVQNFEFLFKLAITVERVRIPCQETPNNGAGTCHIIALFGMW